MRGGAKRAVQHFVSRYAGQQRSRLGAVQSRDSPCGPFTLLAEPCRCSYPNICSRTACTFSGCVYNATKNSHRTENRQSNGTLLVGVLYSVDMLTKSLDFFFLFFFLWLLWGSCKRTPYCRMTLFHFITSQFWIERRWRWCVGMFLWSLRHATTSLHLLQSFRQVAVVRLEFVDLVQRWPQLSSQVVRENILELRD